MYTFHFHWRCHFHFHPHVARGNVSMMFTPTVENINFICGWETRRGSKFDLRLRVAEAFKVFLEFVKPKKGLARSTTGGDSIKLDFSSTRKQIRNVEIFINQKRFQLAFHLRPSLKLSRECLFRCAGASQVKNRKRICQTSSTKRYRSSGMKPINFNNVEIHFPDTFLERGAGRRITMKMMCREASKCH